MCLVFTGPLRFYFGKYGIKTSLLKADYILVGAWGLVPIIVSIFIISWYLFVSPPVIKMFRDNKNISATVFTIFALSMLALFVKGIFVLLQEYDIGTVPNIWRILLISLPMTAIYYFAYSLIKSAKSKNNIHSNAYLLLGFGFGFITISLMYINYYAKDFYPIIPSHIGGAKPVKVQVFVNHRADVSGGFKEFGLKKINSYTWEGVLILTTDSEYFFKVEEKDEAVRINKDDIKTIRYNVPKAEDKVTE